MRPLVEGFAGSAASLLRRSSLNCSSAGCGRFLVAVAGRHGPELSPADELRARLLDFVAHSRFGEDAAVVVAVLPTVGGASKLVVIDAAVDDELVHARPQVADHLEVRLPPLLV